jgi:radical SAM superfamily enzyme YgiQ (UPF0313 family)
MKILFANPPWFTADPDGRLRQGIRAGSRWPFTRHAIHHPDHFEFGAYLPFPFFLSAAAAYTKRLMPNAEIVVRDSIARGEAMSTFDAYLYNFKPDYVVIETATAALENDLAIIQRETDVPCKFILAGPIDKEHHNEILSAYKNVHAIVQGEYDLQIAKAIHSPRSIHAHQLLAREELLTAPFPLWDESCATHYWDGCPEGQIRPQLQMWTSRGCPFKCCFCVFPATMTGNDPDGTNTRTVRFHSADWVERYIRERIDRHGFKSVYFDDDTFNLNQHHTRMICAVMSRIGLPWSAMCRADTIDRPTWQLMKDSGCFGVKIGFESGSQWVIDHIVNKRLDLKNAEETCLWLQSIGIKVHTTWTVGLPGETKEQRQETMDAIRRMYDTGAHTTHQLSGTATIEGTPLSEISKGRHLDKYDGAIADERFVVSADGQQKVEAMR